jgi:uncharacterized membrane protein YhaH (DUF805 family)
MGIVFCPHCYVSVTVDEDAVCPRCGAAIEQDGEPSPANDQFAARESVNPYQAPTEASVESTLVGAGQRDVLAIAFGFQGRIPRRVYWGGMLVNLFLYFASMMLIGGLFGRSDLAQFLILVSYVPFFWIWLALHVKRWHDRGKSGLWVFIQLVPCIGPLWQFIETGCLRGTVGANRFGPDPT